MALQSFILYTRLLERYGVAQSYSAHGEQKDLGYTFSAILTRPPTTRLFILSPFIQVDCIIHFIKIMDGASCLNKWRWA